MYSPIQRLMMQDIVLACALTPKFYHGPDKQPYLRRAVPLYIAKRTGLSRRQVENSIQALQAGGWSDYWIGGVSANPPALVRLREVRHGWHYYRVLERVI